MMISHNNSNPSRVRCMETQLNIRIMTSRGGLDIYHTPGGVIFMLFSV